MADGFLRSTKLREASPVSDIHILWMTPGLGCDGDSVSITAATQPSIEDVFSARSPAFRKSTRTTRCWPTKSATSS